jgi:hypothetical protein
MTASFADAVDFIMAYEAGDCTAREVIDGFAMLIKTGRAWALQGHYGRTAVRLIKAGYITDKGVVLKYAPDLED